MNGDVKAAEYAACEFKEIFGDRYYLELQDHYLDKQKGVNEQLIQMAAKLKLPLVATNDVHYLDAADADPHQVLLCVQTGTTMDDPKKMNYGSKDFYLKTQQEMAARLPRTSRRAGPHGRDRRAVQLGLEVRSASECRRRATRRRT